MPASPSRDADQPLSVDSSEHSTNGEEDGTVGEFERQRQELIRRNQARLAALGIPTAVAALQQTVAASKKAKPGRPAKPKKAPGPTRHSSRLHPQADDTPATPEEQAARELALFLIDGECPRCGKVIERNHKAHLSRCTGVRRPQPLTRADKEAEEAGLAEDDEDDGRQEEEEEEEGEDEDAQQAKARRQADKLRELELCGLVDLTPDHAKFIVLGSTGKHYPVTLTDQRHTCACPDHRIRRHDCKHIKLVLGQLLGSQYDATQWRQAVEDKLDSLAKTEDVRPKKKQATSQRRRPRAESMAAEQPQPEPAGLAESKPRAEGHNVSSNTQPTIDASAGVPAQARPQKRRLPPGWQVPGQQPRAHHTADGEQVAAADKQTESASMALKFL